MLARLQKVSTIELLFLALLWLLGCRLYGAPAWAYVISLAILFSHALLLALEFVLLFSVHGNDPVPRARPTALMRAWLAEARTAMQVFNWRQPFRWQQFPDTIASAGAGRASHRERAPAETGTDADPDAVILVHGFICNRGVWLPLLERLRSARIPYVTVNLEPVLADSIDLYVPALERAVVTATMATGRPPVIVAHSMGGLVVRAWLAQCVTHAPDGAAFPVKHVITIGTPHRGTWLARFGRAPNVKQMRQGSAWLARLEASESRTGRAADMHHRFTCFYSDCDNIVMPSSTATLPGADNRLLSGAAHIDLVFREEIYAEMVYRARWRSE